MNALEKAIVNAMETQGNREQANKAYLEFIKANFIIPIEAILEESEPVVLYLFEKEHAYLPVFTNMEWFDEWVVDVADKVHLLKLSGVDLLKGLGENVSVCLNIGSPYYKEFNPAELARMRSMVLKFFNK